ncbi:TPA: hypothetical protein MFN15_001636 [Klebsiella pneumoniae]|nr:hypothetical protein [Klebsiella pneumoniae]
MDSQKQRDLIASLYEELVIARGLIKEICTVRSIAEPKSTLLIRLSTTKFTKKLAWWFMADSQARWVNRCW